MVLDSLYQCGIGWSVPCGISNTQSAFQWYWTVCISVALDGLYLGDIGQPVSWWHWTACISVELNSLWLSANSLRDLMVLSTGCYTCTGGNSKGCAAVWQNWSCHVIQASSQCSSAGYAGFGSRSWKLCTVGVGGSLQQTRQHTGFEQK